MYNSIYPNINYHKYSLPQRTSTPYNAQNNQYVNNQQQNQKQSSNNANQQTFPNGTRVAIDYNKGQINISQVLTDFRNTIVAINAPDDVKDEVYLYLNLVEREAKKQSPSRDIVLANLKNASKISDEYIANSLHKPSNVVEGWIDALFLQKINLRANPEEVNPNFLLDFPKAAQDKINAQVKEEQSVVQNTEQNIGQNVEQEAQIPQDEIDLESIAQQSESELLTVEDKQTNIQKPQARYENLEVESSIEFSENTDRASSDFNPINVVDAKAREIFSKVKTLPETNEGYTDAVNMLNEALGLMDNGEEVNENIKAAIHLERGRIFDKYDYVDYALRDYFEATKANDLNLKANAFYKTGKIYDEFSEFSPALDNYLSSVAYSGEADNYAGQSTVLSKIADLYARQYDIENFDDFSELALDAAQETTDENLVANTYSNNAQNYQYLGENDKALINYRNALELFSRNDESYEQMAYNYEQAAIVMKNLGNSLKAERLQEKALRYYQLAQQEPEKLAEAN